MQTREFANSQNTENLERVAFLAEKRPRSFGGGRRVSRDYANSQIHKLANSQTGEIKGITGTLLFTPFRQEKRGSFMVLHIERKPNSEITGQRPALKHAALIFNSPKALH